MFFRCDVDAVLAVNSEAAILIAQDRHKFKQLAREAVRYIILVLSLLIN